MAPGLRSGRTGHPRVAGAGGADPGGCSPQRTDAGGEGRCLRTRLRVGAAGMLANCLLSVAVLLLLVRCALAAEEKSTYDASGSSPLPSNPAITGIPAHPSADLSVAEEVPFPVVHSDSHSDSDGEGLSGQPAFSSVLTMMAGTVKHPVSLDQSRTFPTITRDETHTTQWPSRNSSQGSDMSSSSSHVGASSGLTFSMSQKHTPPQTVGLTVSRLSHVFFMNGNNIVSSLPSSDSSSQLTALMSSPSPSPSTLSAFSSFVPPFFLSSSTKGINKALQTEMSVLSPAGSQGWSDSLTISHSIAQSAADLQAVTQGRQSTTSKPLHFSTETSIDKSNKVTKHSPVDKTQRVSELYIGIASPKEIQTLSTSTYTSYSIPKYSQNLLNILYRPTQMQNPGMNFVYANDLEMNNSFPSNLESQAVQSQQGASQNPTSALLSAHPTGYSISSHITQWLLSQTAYMEKEVKTAADSHTFGHERDAVMSSLSSHVRTPTVLPAMAITPRESFFTVSLETSPAKMTLSETAITKLTGSHSGVMSSEHASNPGDLLIAAGHSSPRVPAISVIYNQGEIAAAAELRSVSTHAHLNNSLSLAQLKPDSTTHSVPSLSTSTGTTLSTVESDLFNLRPRNVQESVIGSSKGITQMHVDYTTSNTLFSSNNRIEFLSEPAKKMIYETKSRSHVTQPTYNSNHNNVVDDSTEIYSSSEVYSANQPKSISSLQIAPSERPLQTRPLHNIFHKFYTLSLTSQKSEETVVSSAETSAHTKSQGATEMQIRAENTKTLQVSPLFNGNKDSALISDTMFYNKETPFVFTTRFPSLGTKTDFFTLTKVSAGSGKSSTEIPFSPVTFEPLKRVFHKDNMTFLGHNELSEITLTQTNYFSHSQGPVTTSNKSNFHLETNISFNVSPAVTTSSSDGQNSMETSSAIFSLGTKLMAPYTHWKTTKPMLLENSAFKLENTSISFDRAKSNSPAVGPSFKHPKLEQGQERMLNSTNSAAVASDPYPVYPTGDYPSFAYVKGTSDYKEKSLSTANPRSSMAVIVQQDGFLSLSHKTADSATSSQTTHLELVYKSKHNPSLADVHSLESAFDSTVTLSDNPVHSISGTDNFGKTTDSILKTSTFPADLVSASSSYHSSSSSSSPPPFALPSSSPLLSSYIKPTTSMATKASMYQGSASLSAEQFTLTSSSPSMISSLDSNHSPEVTETLVLTEAETDELTAGTSKAVGLTFPKEKEASLTPSQSVRITHSAGPTERTSQVSPLTPRQDTTTASVKLTTTTASTTKTKNPTTTMPSLRVTTQSTTTTTPQTTVVTRRTTTTTTTVRTQSNRRTFTPPILKMSPPRGVTGVFMSPFTTTTETPPQQCNITERMWVKTVVSIYVRRNRLDSIQRQNLRRGLSQGLRKALNDTSAQAQVETVFGSPNMTVAYHVTGADIVYPPSVVLEGLASYGRDKLIADLRQYLPMVTALPLPVALWRPSPATGFQLKTVLQFVGVGDDPRSCRFSQMMEQRLEKVFSEAQAKVLNANSRLSVQMLSVSQAASYPSVSLVYTVKNGTAFLNGTAASNLLGQLSAELVGYFLFYPPLVIAEPMEYHNLNTSIATRDFWVVTVIQDVDNASLEGQYQSFASLMEQRLAELFVLAGQQGTRFRRATTVGSYTVQMVSIRRTSGLKNPAEMTYYVQHNGIPLLGTSAAKVLNTVDSQTMALTLGYFVQVQAEPVVKNPPNNLWIIAAVLAPISVVTLILIIIAAVLCRKNKNDFKADAIGNLNPRAKMAYRRDVGYYHQPVQGFDYAKQHLGQQGGDEETLPVSQDTLVMSLQIRDTPLSREKALQQDGTANKKSLTADKHKSKLPSEDGSVISNESEKPNSGRGLTVSKITAQQKLTKEETRKRDDPYDTSSGSLQLISIKPIAAQTNYSHPASSDRSQDSAIVNGEVNLALKQKSDIEHYRNKLRLKAKRKGYYDFPYANGSSSSRAVTQRQRHGHERAADEHGRPLEPDDERGSTYVKSHRRHSQVGQTAYRSRQSLSSPSPGGTEMDLLVMRERPRRGIRNSGYDTEPELIEETNVDRLMGPRGYMLGRGLKGHSETSTLSSQPSIDEVRQQMHLLLEEAFSLASGGQSTSGRHSHHQPNHYSPAPPPLPYADVVTSAPGTMSSGRGGLQWVPSYGADMYQCSLPKPAFRFTQLPEAMGSPPPLPPRTGPPPGTSLRRSTSDLGPKGRSLETSVTEMQSQHDNNPYGSTTRAALPSITAEQPVCNYSGNPITAVYAIPATRPGYSEYFVSTPPTSYHSPSWMSYPPEPEDVPPQWADSVPLPGYVEAFPHPRYPQGSPTRLSLQYNQTLEPPPTAPSTASQQSLPQVLKDMDSMPLSSLSTSALVQAIRQEVAKLAKKQNDMFEF